ncbi:MULTISPECIES: ABC transporter substrate-binding protein [unclassified Microbacterium]|uniref:ABC transporter substrate-binding protein n=1 Tax=unclassified Microbacterium TaxID=2609290 RepID=UPI00214BFD9E|nr:MULTISPECIES: ABC transporter substrate-binding protein [unclassified Microbacterium]MCR2800394.1 ABC transporter substrate-binding protein [Microbacterium sp. zg.Y818]MCR2826228.1 ABC transporter substrate-binding protein [Microbacterium sp. zg.Y909]WIM22354.1 ABC transporter substrate-binding protein [Microbacterium sp. zg-Y818]
MTRTPARAIAVGLAGLALVLTSCAGGSGQASGSVQGTELVIAQTEAVQTFDPAAFRGRATQYVVRQIMTPLMELDNDLQVIPALATEWEMVSDTTWQVKLRDDVTFTNGEVFDAAAVKYNFDRILDPDTASPRRSLVVTLDSVEVVDEHTVNFHTTQRDGAFPLALAYIEMAAPGYMEEVGPEQFAKSPIGTGPFVFVSDNPGRGIILERNEDYFGEVAKVERLVIKVIPETASRIAALQSGEAHIIGNVPADLAATLFGSTEAVSASGTEVWHLGMQVERGQFADKSVRQAMQHAVNQKEIAEAVFEGGAEPLNQPAFQNMNCYNPDFEGYDFDPEKASKVLSELPPVTLDTVESEKYVAEAIAGQLRAAGLKVNVNSMEDGAYLARINAGDSELYLASWGAGRGTCDEIWRQHFHSSTRESQVFTGYTSPEVDRLIDTAFSHVPDMDAANEYYEPLIEMLMDDSPWVPIVNPDQIYGVSTSVKGFVPSPIGQYNVTGVELKE